MYYFDSYHKAKSARRKKRAFINSFQPKLIMRRFNSVRIPVGIYGSIWLRYLKDGKNNGYSDFRDFLTDITSKGLARVRVEQDNGDIQHRFDLLLQKKRECFPRIKTVKVDLNAINISDVNLICRSYSCFDVYDSLSYILLIGWSYINGGVDYRRNDKHEKIFS